MKSGLTSDDKDSTFRRELENNTKPKPDPLHFQQKGDTLTAPFGRSSLASDAVQICEHEFENRGTNLKTYRAAPVLIGPKMDPKHIRPTRY